MEPLALRLGPGGVSSGKAKRGLLLDAMRRTGVVLATWLLVKERSLVSSAVKVAAVDRKGPLDLAVGPPGASSGLSGAAFDRWWEDDDATWPGLAEPKLVQRLKKPRRCCCGEFSRSTNESRRCNWKSRLRLGVPRPPRWRPSWPISGLDCTVLLKCTVSSSANTRSYCKGREPSKPPVLLLMRLYS